MILFARQRRNDVAHATSVDRMCVCELVSMVYFYLIYTI